jgi:hypothetical protein
MKKDDPNTKFAYTLQEAGENNENELKIDRMFI